MNYVSAQSQALINGAIVYRADVSINAGRSLPLLELGWAPRPDVEVDLQVIVTENTEDALVTKLEWWHRLCYDFSELQLIALGDGFVCPYCGDYNPAGRAACWRCGGRMERQPFVRVEGFPFGIRSFYIEMADTLSFSVQQACISLEMISFARIEQLHLDMLWRSNDVRLECLPNDYTLDIEHYLCQYCGSVVDNGRQCPNCGGQRLPWSELVKIDRECLYCGRKTTNGIVCSGCAASINGQALRGVLQ